MDFHSKAHPAYVFLTGIDVRLCSFLRGKDLAVSEVEVLEILAHPA